MNNTTKGFTLVEILVALTILAITMGAYLGQLDSQITQTHDIRNRTLAHWAGQNHLAKMRLDEQWPSPGKQTLTSFQGQQEWLIQQHVSVTPNSQMKRVELQMFDADGAFSGTLVGYLFNDK